MFESLYEAASLGVILMMEEAPINRAFTVNHWTATTANPNVIARPSLKAFDLAAKLGLVEEVGPHDHGAVYRMTRLGIHFKHYVKGVVEIRESEKKVTQRYAH